ncbi:hypothetical protein PSTG_16292 [Puccinia striiformis f. sp. tritici PST-78]|uniref:hAT-like transposase RNase-H fold domain-containing protein n=1 Tax=Puccinia striiformis f. sp. tritici PST-78 TaxID=1165861 RepID=A0A0L0UTK1_9BASI|nr:hypothetical protein PSTG_16292 [Puccinia striiformis f. sp. tritici PST-78]
MIEELKKFKWVHFKGKANWVRCFTHILNLIAQVVMRPFGSHKKKRTTNNLYYQEEGDSDDGDINGEDADEQIQGFNKEIEDCSKYDNDNDDHSASPMATDLIDEDKIKLESADVNDLSDEDKNDRYTSQLCKQSLSKVSPIARKLNKLPHSKEAFVQFCRENKCLKPHNVKHNVKTRWNSTLMQLTSIVLAYSLEWQKDKHHGPAQKYFINQNDLDLACNLIEILQPFYNITLQVSTRGGARIAQVVVFMDQLTSHLSTAISNKTNRYPAALRNASQAGIQLTNKYYTLTDCSPLYRVAMGESSSFSQLSTKLILTDNSFLVLHPSFKDEYFKLAQWDPEWIEEAIRLAREMWESHYKPTPQRPTSKEPNACPKPPPTGVLAGLSGASEA